MLPKIYLKCDTSVLKQRSGSIFLNKVLTGDEFVRIDCFSLYHRGDIGNIVLCVLENIIAVHLILHI